MSGTTTTTPPVAYVDQTGIHAPAFTDVLTWFIAQYQSIYGQDVYLGNDSQDGQWIAVIAQAITDLNSLAVQVYQCFSPSTAQGAGLSSVVKINNIRRLVSTNSTVDLTIVGQNGTQIINGIARDANQNNWILPTQVSVPGSGQIVVTAVAANAGAIAAPSGTVTTILTPTQGWQSVINLNPAVPGDPIETDVVLRNRQAMSTALPSQTILDGLIGAVSSIPGVIRVSYIENDTNATDVNGVPPNSLAMIVDGGDAQTIGYTIANKKTLGCSTYGTTTVNVSDISGATYQINFFRPTPVPITVAFSVRALSGYTSNDLNASVNAISAYISNLPIGQQVYVNKVLVSAMGPRLNVASLEISRNGAAVGSADVAIAFNEAAVCTVDNISPTVLVH